MLSDCIRTLCGHSTHTQIPASWPRPADEASHLLPTRPRRTNYQRSSFHRNPGLDSAPSLRDRRHSSTVSALPTLSYSLSDSSPLKPSSPSLPHSNRPARSSVSFSMLIPRATRHHRCRCCLHFASPASLAFHGVPEEHGYGKFLSTQTRRKIVML
jgi:hypothetical protein